MKWQVIRHDCEFHTHDWSAYGPFRSRKAAESFIEENDLWIPMDGGYAFALAVPAPRGETFGQSPEEYAADIAEIEADFTVEPEALAGVPGSTARSTSTTQ